MRVWLAAIGTLITVWALVEVIQADPSQVRRLPKWAWVVAIVLTWPIAIGSVAWFWLGRPKVTASTPGARGPRRGTGMNLPMRRRYVARPAPDDDPEFLGKLNAEAERDKLLRRMQDDLESRKPADPDDPDAPRA
ncbi:MAG: PLD nuclease N-terminal domain-containing protein [Sporichthyaceae bacterium]